MSEAVKENEHQDDPSVPVEELDLEPQLGQVSDANHFLDLAQIGAANPDASSGERQAARLAQCVLDNVPGLDASGRLGLWEFIQLACLQPETARGLIPSCES